MTLTYWYHSFWLYLIALPDFDLIVFPDPMSQNKVRKLRAIMFADIQGYTSIMQTDEQLASEKLERFRSELHQKTREFNGEIVNFFGDGCLCIFESSVMAVSCALGLQKSFKSDIPVRIGLHSGDVYFTEDTVYGDAVNIASRIETLAVPNAVLFSKRISQDIKNQSNFNFTPLGSFAFKNVTDPVEVFALVDSGLSIPSTQDIQKKIAKKKIGKSKRILQYAGILGLITVVFLLVKLDWNDLFGSVKKETESVAIAVLNFENQTQDSSVDIVGKMAANRLIHGITSNKLGRVITGESIEEFENVMQASLGPVDQLDFLQKNFSVGRLVKGNIYEEDEQLVVECTITDAKTKEIIEGLPTVRCSKTSPGKCIEEIKQLLLGALVSESDKKLNLLLETSTPKFEAFQELTLAKEAETNERMIYHLDRAIAIDSTYFEPLVLRLSGYYNLNQYAVADSLLSQIDETLWATDPRQKNLLSFYDALLKGQNNLVFKHFYEELKLAPFELMTNNTVMVLALQFTYDLEKAAEVYAEIPDKFDYANCSRCRTRLYLKMYLDLENDQLNDAIAHGNTLLKNRGWNWAESMMIRAYVRKGDWENLDLLKSFAPGGSLEDPARHFLSTARECLMAGHEEKAEHYLNLADQYVNENTSLLTLGDLYLMMGKVEEAIAPFEQLIAMDSTDYTHWSRLGTVYAMQGNSEEVNRVIAYMESLRGPYQFGRIDYDIARIRMAQGNIPETIAKLQQSVNQGRHYYFHAFHNDYRFRSIKDRPDFRRLLSHWR